MSRITCLTLFMALFISSLNENTFAAPPTFSYNSSAIGQGTVDPQNGEYKRNWYLAITAIPDEAWIFDHWEGDMTGNQNSVNLRITSDKNIVAVFVEEVRP